MKILIVRTFPSILSSTSYNVQEIGLAKAYVRAGHTCDIVMFGGSEPTHEVKIETGESSTPIIIYYMKSFGILKNGFFPGLKKLASKYDKIQIHEYDQVSSWMIYTDKKLRDKTIIYHGPYYSDFNKGYNLRCKLFDTVFKTLKFSPEIPCFTKSNAAAKFLEGKGFKNVTPVGVGLDTDVWDLNPLPEAEKKDEFTFLYVGKLEPRRNTLFLLDVVDRLLSEHDDTHFLLIGDGEEEYKKACLDKASKWIDAGRITYIPKASQTDMPKYYQSSDCMLFPSNYEIFGMVLMEAIYFGVPVITSDNGGADTLYRDGENAIIVNSNVSGCFSIDEWAAAAERLYSDKELVASIKSQLSIDKTKLGWDYIAAKILKNI